MEPLPSDHEHLARHLLDEAATEEDARRDGALVAFASLALIALALSWIDVLPGGWTLRGLVVPHELREERARTADRAARLAQFRAETPPRQAVVFLGSSTMERFPLQDAFPGCKTVNRGIGDEPIAQLLERLDDSLPPAPVGAVLYMGSVDLRRLGRTPAEVVELAGRVLDGLETRHPGLPVALLGVLPDRTGDPRVLAEVEAANGLLLELCRRRGAAFVDPHRAPLRTEDGRLDREHSVDRLHLSRRGYGVVTELILEHGGPVGALLGGSSGSEAAALFETHLRNPQ